MPFLSSFARRCRCGVRREARRLFVRIRAESDLTSGRFSAIRSMSSFGKSSNGMILGGLNVFFFILDYELCCEEY